MKERLMAGDGFVELALSQIGESFGHLRLVHPRWDASMVQSMRKYGQLSPVVVSRPIAGCYELIDGFKRLRACRTLDLKSLKATVLDAGIRACKAAMIQLNWKAASMTKLEEAMVLHSLFREDGLTQAQMATLLGRHKSWVCRRISLIERLCDEALELIKLGLLSVTAARELARLPRGNQQAALGTIQKYHLDSRESARLVSILLERPRWEHQVVLNFPQEILDDRMPQRPRSAGGSRAARPIQAKLMAIERNVLWILKALNSAELSKKDRGGLTCILGRIAQSFAHIKSQLS
jgi:ParB/RepB/Spo0J family partition protein